MRHENSFWHYDYIKYYRKFLPETFMKMYENLYHP